MGIFYRVVLGATCGPVSGLVWTTLLGRELLFMVYSNSRPSASAWGKTDRLIQARLERSSRVSEYVRQYEFQLGGSETIYYSVTQFP